jgi:CheY-like chemotaxis protein
MNESTQMLSGVKVLLVEDVQDNQALVKMMLGKQGAQISIANDGIEGVKMAMSGDFDVVLMDIQMPRMGGYEAISELRKKNYQKPVIALTAHALEEEQKKTQEAGFNGHLTKPLNRKQLLETILSFAKTELN